MLEAVIKLKPGDKARNKETYLEGVFVKVTDYTGYIQGGDESTGRWRTPECTIRDLLKYWKVIAHDDDKNPRTND
jgi:hypothetical protein